MEGIISFGRERKVTGKSRAKAHFWPDVNAFRRKFIPIVSIPAVVVSRLCRIFMRFVFLSARQQNYTECDHNVGNARAAIAIRWEGSLFRKVVSIRGERGEDEEEEGEKEEVGIMRASMMGS